MPAKLKVDQIESVDGSANITVNNSVTMASGKTLPAASLTGTVAANTVDSDSYVDGSIDTAHIAADNITSALIADDQIDSEHIVDGSIDLAHMSANSVDSDQYVDGSIDSAHIGDDQVDAQHIAASCIGNAFMAANSIDSAQYVDGSIDAEHLADNAVTLAKMASGTDGNIISYDASGDPVAIATGSDGQVLTSTGAGSPPAFEALPASGMEDLSPYFQGHNQSGQVPSSGVYTKLTFGEGQDSDSAFASSRFTVPTGKGGRYFLTTTCSLIANSSSRITSSRLVMYKNGSSAAIGAESPGGGMYMNSNGPHATMISFQCILTLAVGDYLEVYGQVTAATGAVSIGARTFTGFKIGA